jgi:hypothetical protein
VISGVRDLATGATDMMELWNYTQCKPLSQTTDEPLDYHRDDMNQDLKVINLLQVSNNRLSYLYPGTILIFLPM